MIYKGVVLVTTSKDSQLVTLDAGSVSGSWAWYSSSFVTRNSWVAGISNICWTGVLQGKGHSMDIVGCQVSIGVLASEDICLVIGNADGMMRACKCQAEEMSAVMIFKAECV